MITLITGAPGAGKTAALVSLLGDLAKGRAIYVDGVPELKLTHLPLEDARKWTTDVPDGAVVVIDEVQRIWRPAGSAQRVPDDIAGLETHRHRGLDFYIVTQHPKLLHANVRALVGRHVHLRDVGLFGRHWYEWPECTDVASWRSAPVKKRYRLPTKVFGQYKSATEHIKPVRSIPPVAFVLAGSVVAVGTLGWFTYRAVSGKFSSPPVVASPAAASPVVATAAPGARRDRNAAVIDEAAKLLQLRGEFIPRLSWRPETAPAYDALRVVTAMPRIVGGYCQGGQCICFNNQGLRASLSSSECGDWIKAPPFDPYREAVPAANGNPSPYGAAAGQAQAVPVPSTVPAS